MPFLILLLLLSLGSSGIANTKQQDSDNKKLVQENLDPIFEDIQPEFGLYPKDLIVTNASSPELVNVTGFVGQALSNTTSGPDNSTATAKQYFNCTLTTDSTVVQLVNDTELIKLLAQDPKNMSDKTRPGQCMLVLFYSKNCPFSSSAAPHFNALPRAYPGLKMVAINAMRYHLFNTQNGIVGVPTLLLFHNGRPVVRYIKNEYSLEWFIKFVNQNTGLDPVEKCVVTSQDFAGPVVSSPSKESDMFLVISWLFIIVASCYYFSKSMVWKWMVETVQRYWRESEQHADHQHVD